MYQKIPKALGVNNEAKRPILRPIRAKTKADNSKQSRRYEAMLSAAIRQERNTCKAK